MGGKSKCSWRHRRDTGIQRDAWLSAVVGSRPKISRFMSSHKSLKCERPTSMKAQKTTLHTQQCSL